MAGFNVQTEDITVPWGQQPDPAEHTFGKWRLTVFQDMQESLDSSKLYFLYDPIADDSCITTGKRKGLASLVVFDAYRKCFVAEIPLRVQGRVKFIFALKSPSPAGGTAIALVTESEDYGSYAMHLWRVDINSDGLSLSKDPYSLLTQPLIIDEGFICTMREDAPELVVIFGPGMNVARVNASAMGPSETIDRFNVPGGELSHFYDGYVSRGNFYFVSATPDGHFDNSRIHILNLISRGSLTTQYLQPDPARGMPPPRKQAAMDSISGFILLAGGEIDHGHGNVTRLVDYWVLDLTSFRWNQVAAQMPVPLIEPRLTTTNSGIVYLWGDFDQPLPGMPPSGTHIRILRIRGLNVTGPPSYEQAVNYSYGAPPAGSGGGYPPMGGPGGGYPGARGGAPYPSQGYNTGGAQAPGYGYSGGHQYNNPSQTYGTPYYPQNQQKDNCVVS